MKLYLEEKENHIPRLVKDEFKSNQSLEYFLSQGNTTNLYLMIFFCLLILVKFKLSSSAHFLNHKIVI
jgi:hypothetical protein